MDDLKIYELIMSRELTWEGLLRDIIKKENVNPWDIDVKFLADKYREAVMGLEHIDFKLCGKFLLASAILLKMKSDEFNVNEFLNIPEEYFEEFLEDLDVEYMVSEFKNYGLKQSFKESGVTVDLRTPRERMRPVSVDDLVAALREAIEVQDRRDVRKQELKEKMNYHADVVAVDITEKIKQLYNNIVNAFQNLRREELLFKELVPSNEKKDIVWTFVPLLHLSNDGKIEISQKVQFGDISIKMPEIVTAQV
ncbi:Segregation and condensation protein A [Candidatus Tiddalikarchaeum anstoanum]|nr:Segregation and condensation protein A [Candidatus Tiddalikarchaeum anstoanum]